MSLRQHQPPRAGERPGRGSGTALGGRTQQCTTCGYRIALLAGDEPPECPSCGSREFEPAPLLTDQHTTSFAPARLASGVVDAPGWLAEARERLAEPGCYLAFDATEGPRMVTLPEGFTRLGRSLAADVRFDDPTVSRRHGVLHREGPRVRVVDDRSLNGIYVNGERVDWRELDDGDEIALGRFRLYYVRAG